MLEEKRIPCPHCGEQILPLAKKCHYCKEWLEKPQPKENFQSPKQVQGSPREQNKQKSQFPIRLILFIIFVGFGITLGVYEYNAHQILTYAESLNAEGLYETSEAAYEKILTDYSLSIATVEVNKQIENPNREYLFPLWTSEVCGFVLFFLIGIRASKGNPSGGIIFLLITTGIFFVIQLVAYDKLDIKPLEEIASELMKKPQIAFFIAYALTLFTGIAIISNPDPYKD